MIKIEFDEKSVFTYSPDTLTIHAWDHKEGKFKGDIIGEVGSIKFSGEWQACHFMEMLEFMIEKIENKKPNHLFTTIRTDEYNKLIEDQKILQALRASGVDDWEWYDAAMESLDE